MKSLTDPREELDIEQSYSPTDEPAQNELSQFDAHKYAVINQKEYNEKVYRFKKKKVFKLYPVNSKVFIKNHSLSNAAEGIVASFLSYWIGPYRITKVFPSADYLCEANDSNDVRKVAHADIQLVLDSSTQSEKEDAEQDQD